MIEINGNALQQAAQAGMDEFIDVFIKAYRQALGGEPNAENMHLLNGSQHALLSYDILREEVNSGGFIQLIQNGYGPYILLNPFAKAMRQWGVNDLSKLMYKVREVYEANREDLEKERDDDAFMAMYEQYEVFDDFEEQFMDMEEMCTSLIAIYVDEHLEEFAKIIE